MNFTPDKKFLIFKISWIILIAGIICDLSISHKASFGIFNANIQLSSITIILFILSFFAILPVQAASQILKNKFYTITSVLLFLLLSSAYISSYFSLMPGYALITTTSRYTLFFLVFVVTMHYVQVFEKANEFILKTFIYANLFITISCLADYYIPAFHQLLIDHFGHMETRHFLLSQRDTHYMRPSGFVTDVNLTAFSLGFSSVLLLLNRKKFNTWFEFAFYISAGVVSGLLASRSAFILVIFMVLFALAARQANLKHVLLFVLLFIAAQFITPQTQLRYLNLGNKQKKIEEMELGRPLIWKACFLAMDVKPSIGIGTSVFFKQSEIYMAKVKNEIDDDTYRSELLNPAHAFEQGINPHNIFFVMFIEHGVPGIVLFTALVVYILIFLIKSKKYNALAAFLGILFVSCLSNYAPYYKYYLLICIIYYVNIKNDLKLKEN